MVSFSNGNISAQDRHALLEDVFPRSTSGAKLYISPKASNDCLLPYVSADEFALYDGDGYFVDFLTDMVNNPAETRDGFIFHGSGMDRNVFKCLADQVRLARAKAGSELPVGLYGALICAARKDFDYYEHADRSYFAGTLATGVVPSDMLAAYDLLYKNIKDKLTFTGLRPVEAVGLHVNSWCAFGNEANSALMFVNAPLNAFSAARRERLASECAVAVMRSEGALTVVVKVPPIPAHMRMFDSAPPAVRCDRVPLPSNDVALVVRCA